MIGRDEVLKPHAPRPGSAVGLISPSSSIGPFPRRVARAMRALAGLGFEPVLAPHALWSDGEKPCPEVLAADIGWCCEREDVDVILCTTGGLTSAEILPYIDYELLRSSRKVLCGFSDITSLLLSVFEQTGMITFHGPALLPSMGDVHGIDPYTAASMLGAWTPDALRVLKEPESTSSDSPWWDRDDAWPRALVRAPAWRALTPGYAQGRLVGGHLGTIAGLLNTPYFPDTDSCLVFVETNDSRVDTIREDLARLAAARVFERAVGVLFGRPLEVDQPEELYRSFAQLAAEHSLPALADVDFGHTVPMLTLPIGARVTIDTLSRLLRIDEEPIAAAR